MDQDNQKQLTTFEELLEKDGRLVYKTKGISMKPMLHQNRDLVFIEPPSGRLRPMDVALYRRGRQYVLHRVITVQENGYLIRGDNTYTMENVPEKAVIGVLTGFVRKGKQHSVTEKGYLLYARFWHAVFPVRKPVVLFKRRVRAFAVKLTKKLGIYESLKNLKHRIMS
ncbi:MAG: S24/S26 family peptidase [Parasporobacterium sp.]|nr:S24/S26 family peptidase [Parasporobacterium sp.]